MSIQWDHIASRWKLGLAAVLAALILFLPFPVGGPAPAERHIRIEASMFQFSPSEIVLNPGDQVTVELVSTDVVHGLSLDGYDFQLTADPGQTAVGTFTADKAGVFRFRCLVPCGNLHPFMIGKIQVGSNSLFWRAIGLGLLAAVVGIWSVSR
jgi:heme/copper-type cytochrome/quinol oxidase subunit 2